MAGLDGGRLNIAACSLGGAQSALDKALAYAGERKAFGQTINQFQALQFKLADMETELQAARMLLYAAAAKLDRKAPDAGKWSAMAKRFVTDTGFTVANDALQLHGGYGYLHDYGVEKLVRDLRVHQILEGTNEIMRVIIARASDWPLNATPDLWRSYDDHHRLHRPRQHGQSDGRQPGQGRASVHGFDLVPENSKRRARPRRRRHGQRAGTREGRRGGDHHAARRQACAVRL